MRVQISFLGTAVLGKDGNYRTTLYDFGLPDGEKWSAQTCSFMGALAQWQRHRQVAVDCMVVVGTSTSMWRMLDELLEDHDVEERVYDLLQEVDESSRSKAGVDAEVLEELCAALSDVLEYKLVPCLIRWCDNTQEQLGLVEMLARHVPTGSKLVMDITHGFRHLPLIAVAVGNYLEQARDCVIEHVYYGMYQPGSASAPVVDMAGMLRIMQAARAIAAFKERGSLSPVARAFDDQVPELDEAAFFFDTFQTAPTKKSSQRARKAVLRSEDPLVRVARDELEKTLSWAAQPRKLHQRQLEMARTACRGRDYQGTTSMLFEAIITASVYAHHSADHQGHQADPHAYHIRKEAQNALEQHLRKHHHSDAKTFDLLKHLRNAMAHGTRPDGSRRASPTRVTAADIQRVLSSRQNLEDKLDELVLWAETLITALQTGQVGPF